MTSTPHKPDTGKAIEALHRFAVRFGLSIETNVIFKEDPNCVALAFVPFFGSPNGVVIDAVESPHYTGNQVLQKYANDHGIFYSQVNVAQLVAYQEKDFLEMFRDWGYFGENPPSWLDNRNT